jgi:hypothetical protein
LIVNLMQRTIDLDRFLYSFHDYISLLFVKFLQTSVDACAESSGE